MKNNIIDYLEITNIYLQGPGNGLTFLIEPVSIEQTKIEVKASDRLPDYCILFVDTKYSKTKYLVKAINEFSEANTSTLFLEDPFEDKLLEKIISLEKINSGREKRKEERYDVGLERWKEFGLMQPVCQIRSKVKNLSCIIANASIHGCLLTGENSYLKTGDKIIFSCKLVNNTINQDAIVINVRILNSKYYQYAVRFLEPVSLYWQQNLINYSEIK